MGLVLESVSYGPLILWLNNSLDAPRSLLVLGPFTHDAFKVDGGKTAFVNLDLC